MALSGENGVSNRRLMAGVSSAYQSARQWHRIGIFSNGGVAMAEKRKAAKARRKSGGSSGGMAAAAARGSIAKKQSICNSMAASKAKKYAGRHQSFSGMACVWAMAA